MDQPVCFSCGSSRFQRTSQFSRCKSCGAQVEERFRHFEFTHIPSVGEVPVFVASADFASKFQFNPDDLGDDPFPDCGFVTAWSSVVPHTRTLASVVPRCMSGEITELERALNRGAMATPQLAARSKVESSNQPDDDDDDDVGNENHQHHQSNSAPHNNRIIQIGGQGGFGVTSTDLRVFLAGYVQQLCVLDTLNLHRAIVHKATAIFMQAATGSNPRNRNVEALAVAAVVAAMQSRMGTFVGDSLMAGSSVCLQDIAQASGILEREIIKHIKTGTTVLRGSRDPIVCFHAVGVPVQGIEAPQTKPVGSGTLSPASQWLRSLPTTRTQPLTTAGAIPPPPTTTPTASNAPPPTLPNAANFSQPSASPSPSAAATTTTAMTTSAPPQTTLPTTSVAASAAPTAPPPQQQQQQHQQDANALPATTVGLSNDVPASFASLVNVLTRGISQSGAMASIPTTTPPTTSGTALFHNPTAPPTSTPIASTPISDGISAVPTAVPSVNNVAISTAAPLTSPTPVSAPTATTSATTASMAPLQSSVATVTTTATPSGMALVQASTMTLLAQQLPGYRSITQQMARSSSVVALQASFIPQLIRTDISLPDGYVLRPAFPFNPQPTDHTGENSGKVLLYQNNTQPPVVIKHQ